MGDTPSTVRELLEIVKKYGFEYFGLYYGKYRGTIINNEDPKKLGRVQLKIPQITGDNKVEYWAWPSGQPAGADFGDFMIPPKNSPVWVTFENGDPRKPVYEGGHWAKENGAVSTTGAGNPKKRIRVSEKWEIEMDDEGDVCRIKSKAGGHKLEVFGNGNIVQQGTGNYTKTTGGNQSDTVTGSLTESSGAKTGTVNGNKSESVTGNAEQTVTGNKSVGCVNFSLTASGTSTCTIGGVTLAFGGGELEVSIGGSNIKINGSGVEIMGKDFITHTHNGVDPGGGSSGGVN